MAAPDLDWWKDLLGEALKGQPRRWRRGGQLNSNQPQAPEFSEGGGLTGLFGLTLTLFKRTTTTTTTRKRNAYSVRWEGKERENSRSQQRARSNQQSPPHSSSASPFACPLPSSIFAVLAPASSRPISYLSPNT